MKIEVIISSGDLKREVWEFAFDAGVVGAAIRLTAYSFQTKDTPRHKWRKETHWGRYFSGNNNIEKPRIPGGVITEMRLNLHADIKNLPVL